MIFAVFDILGKKSFEYGSYQWLNKKAAMKLIKGHINTCRCADDGSFKKHGMSGTGVKVLAGAFVYKNIDILLHLC